MAPTLGLAFLVLLIYGHAVDPLGDAFLRPLSSFRDIEPAWIGYAMFASLLGLGAATVRTALRVQCEWQAALYVLATAILAAVMATPSDGLMHVEFSALMMAVMFINFATLLYVNDQLFWFVMHMLTPTVLMWATKLVSYGVWQKGMILYFLAATVAHERVMAQWLPKRGKRRVKKTKVWVGMRRNPRMELGTSYLA